MAILFVPSRTTARGVVASDSSKLIDRSGGRRVGWMCAPATGLGLGLSGCGGGVCSNFRTSLNLDVVGSAVPVDKCLQKTDGAARDCSDRDNQGLDN